MSLYRVAIILYAICFSCAAIFFLSSSDLKTGLAVLGAAVFVDVIAWLGLRFIKEVSYDSKFLYVSNPFKSVSYELTKVRRINGCWGGFDRTFEIEFFPENGSTLKIDYLPPHAERVRYMWFDEFSGRTLAFKDMLKELHSER